MAWVLDEKYGGTILDDIAHSRWEALYTMFPTSGSKNTFALRVWPMVNGTWQGAVFSSLGKHGHRLSDVVRCDSRDDARKIVMEAAQQIYKAFGGKD